MLAGLIVIPACGGSHNPGGGGGSSGTPAGTYTITSGAMDLQGHLRLKAKLSQMATGKKSFFLKALDPFFEKNGAGTELPISITGTREQPTIGVSVFHKKIEKKLGSPKNSEK